MELQEFIKETLVAIHRGVKAANDEIPSDDGRKYYLIMAGGSEKDRLIEFDVALTASNEKGSKAGAGINVVSVSLGGSKQSTISQSTVSRVKFTVQPNISTG